MWESHARYCSQGRGPSEIVPYTGMTVNLGGPDETGVVTRDHVDCMDYTRAPCTLYNFGSNNYRTGGHLILHDAHLLVEFPPGSIISFYSSIMRHANTVVGCKEIRETLALYTAAGLMRYLQNGDELGSCNDDIGSSIGWSKLVQNEDGQYFVQ
jgi:hypothetical protein